MKLKIVRKHFLPDYTIGQFLVDSYYFADTLEDEVRPPGIKINGKTAIPAGTYKVIMSFSNRFQRIMPEILGVPNFSGVRIHSGTTSASTSGCPLIGKNTIKGGLTSSRFYSNALNTLLLNEKGEISIEIV